MGIADEDIVRVRAATDFVAVVSEHLGLRKVGRRWVGLCPFHSESTPSFSVNAEEGLYYCFGCQAGGDAIRFVEQVEHLSFSEAVERLAARAGLTVRMDSLAATQRRHRRDRLVETMERAVDWYHRRLLHSPDAAAARAYLRARGMDGAEVRHYQLGWAPEGFDGLVRDLSVSDDLVTGTGLGLINNRGRQQDVFRARVLFPIFDVRGDPVALGGRQLPGGPPPKYRNSAETALYSKSRVLYGLNWARAPAVAAGQVVVCEGYTDVMGLARVGLAESVATCGTALTEDHIRLLKNFARRLVLAYDADAAGQGAALRFGEWEQRYELDLAVADLPPGSDPGDLARSDPERLRRAVAEARPFVAFRLERALAQAHLATVEGRARAAETGLAVIAAHPAPLVRDQYLMVLADRVRIDADRLRPTLDRLVASPPARDSQGDPPSRGGRVNRDGGLGRDGGPRRATASGPGGDEYPPASPGVAEEADGTRRGNPDGLAEGRRREEGRDGRDALRGSEEAGPIPAAELEGLRLAVSATAGESSPLTPALFGHPLAAEVCRLLAASGGDLHRAIDSASGQAGDLLQRLAVEEVAAESAEVMARLAERAGRRELLRLQVASRLATDPLTMAAEVAWLQLALDRFRSPELVQEATEALVAWLASGRGEGE
ncbi:MAG: DNA primase [Acidimicrobiales bacterium]